MRTGILPGLRQPDPVDLQSRLCHADDAGDADYLRHRRDHRHRLRADRNPHAVDGLQHALFKLLVIVNTFGLCATAVLTYWLGPIGAALAIAGTIIVWCVTAVFIARRTIGINPSILGFLAGEDALAARSFLKGRS